MSKPDDVAKEVIDQAAAESRGDQRSEAGDRKAAGKAAAENAAADKAVAVKVVADHNRAGHAEDRTRCAQDRG